MSTSIEEKNSLTLTRTFAAPPERVFAAWTQPEQVKAWFGPEGCSIRSIEIDLRVGGTYRFCVASEKHGEMAVGGEYREIKPHSKLSYTWQWEDDPNFVNHETLVTVEFIGKDGSTEVQLTHANLPTAESLQNHEHGWNGALAKLAPYLAS